MTHPSASVVVAAGAVCWRVHHGRLRVLLVRQSGRSDFSLPKGKVTQGESLPETAVRELREETGVAATLGLPLGTSSYTLPTGRDKVVHYWAAEAGRDALAAARFSPNGEIAEAEWMPAADARDALVHDHDRSIVESLVEFADQDRLRTFAVIALRHGKAMPASSWSGPDSTRPLEQIGVRQARSAARSIASYGPLKLVSSTAARCMSTIEPLATLTGRDVKATPAISQDAYEEGEADVARVVAKRLSKRQTAVLCSHGPVLPDILEELARQTGSTVARMRRGAALDVGEYTVVHLAAGDPGAGVLAVETHSPEIA